MGIIYSIYHIKRTTDGLFVPSDPWFVKRVFFIPGEQLINISFFGTSDTCSIVPEIIQINAEMGPDGSGKMNHCTQPMSKVTGEKLWAVFMFSSPYAYLFRVAIGPNERGE